MIKDINTPGYLERCCARLVEENNCEETVVINNLPQRMVFETQIWQLGENFEQN